MKLSAHAFFSPGGRRRPARRLARLGLVLVLPLGALAAVVATAQQISLSTPLHVPGPAAGAPNAADGIAGDPYAYHVGATLLCSDCHSIHFSQQHGFDGGTVATTGAPDGNWLGSVGPNNYLLKAPSSTELCLACHDGKTFAPDVITNDANGLVLRAAGFFEDVEVPNFRGHNLSVDPDPGGGGGFSPLCLRCHFGGDLATAKVQCIDCHAPHGNLSHRNLQWASDPGGEPPLVAYQRPGDLGLARYEADNVAYAAPAGGGAFREVTNMCIDCHHTFFSTYYTHGTSPFIRHPGTNTEWNGNFPIDRPGAHTDPVFWLNGESSFLTPRLKFIVSGATDFAGAATVAANNQVFCLTCHQAHGSQNPFALRWDYSTSGSSTGADGCFQCHRQVLDGE